MPRPAEPPASDVAPVIASVATFALLIPTENLEAHSTTDEPVLISPPIPVVNKPIPFNNPPPANAISPN